MLVSDKEGMVFCGSLGRLNGLHLRNFGANSLRCNNLIRKSPCRGLNGRRRRSWGNQICIYLMLMIVLVSLAGRCESFRQDPVASPNRSTRSTLPSQKNLVDDMQEEGKTSRLQRLLPSAWRNKNMSSWEIVESVRALRCGGIDSSPPGIVCPVNTNETLPPENSLDKAVGRVLTLLGRVVVAQTVATLFTRNDHALLTEVCAVG